VLPVPAEPAVLPVPAEPHEPPAVPSPPARTVLYVDDDPMMVRLVQRMLAREPAIRVLTATGGDIALDLATTGNPDVILLDLNLGGMSGEALLRRLQAGAATRSIPVVIVSGDAAPATMQRLTGLGAVDYLAKPFDAAQLRAVLAAIPSRGTADDHRQGLTPG
jgi:CheY-like chemotaxis protein